MFIRGCCNKFITFSVYQNTALKLYIVFSAVLRIRILSDPAKSERAYTVYKTVNSELFLLLDTGQ